METRNFSLFLSRHPLLSDLLSSVCADFRLFSPFSSVLSDFPRRDSSGQPLLGHEISSEISVFSLSFTYLSPLILKRTTQAEDRIFTLFSCIITTPFAQEHTVCCYFSIRAIRKFAEDLRNFEGHRHTAKLKQLT